jgi:hypothetical protein
MCVQNNIVSYYEENQPINYNATFVLNEFIKDNDYIITLTIYFLTGSFIEIEFYHNESKIHVKIKFDEDDLDNFSQEIQDDYWNRRYENMIERNDESNLDTLHITDEETFLVDDSLEYKSDLQLKISTINEYGVERFLGKLFSIIEECEYIEANLVVDALNNF